MKQIFGQLGCSVEF